MATERKTRDMPGVIAALVFIALGLWVLAQTRGMSALGSVFPMTIAIALIVFSAALIVMNLMRPKRTAPAVPEEASAAESPARRIGLIVAMGAWILLIPILGFFAASVLAFLAILAVSNYDPLGLRHIVIYVVTAVVIVAAFQWLMAEVLLIPVPGGVLF